MIHHDEDTSNEFDIEKESFIKMINDFIKDNCDMELQTLSSSDIFKSFTKYITTDNSPVTIRGSKVTTCKIRTKSLLKTMIDDQL